MASKIRSITAVNLHGYHTYFVGETYHGLILDKIEDKTIEFPDLMTVTYRGFTVNQGKR